MRRFFVCLCVMAVAMAKSSKPHKWTSDDDIVYTFGQEAKKEVVEVAYGDHNENPGQKIMQLTSFSREMKFYLEPTDGYLADVNTPVFRARHSPGMINDVEYERIPGAMSGKHKMYQDVKNNTAVVIHHDSNGFPIINAVINCLKEKYTLVIRPLLERFRKLFNRKKRSVDSDPNLKYTHHHVVYKVPHKESNNVDDYVDNEDEYVDDYSFENEVTDDDDDKSRGDEHEHPEMIAMTHGKRKRMNANNIVPDIIYPQVLVIVGSTLFDHFKRDVPSIIEYLLAYWNGVDLRFRAFLKPDIRLNIAGIILAEDDSMTTYITENRVYIRDFKNQKINVTGALSSMATFMFPETTRNKSSQTLRMKRLGFEFDLAMTMTTLDICQLPPNCANEKTREYTCFAGAMECGTYGYAFYTGGCAFDGESKLMEGVGIIEDKGSFFSVVPTAHEIGHLLGASHSKTNQHKCDWDDGYLMSHSVNPKRESFIWSNCSVESIKYFLRGEERAQCLFDKPKTGDTIARKLPGKMFSRDELCDRAIPGASACKDPWFRNHCAYMYCQRPYQNDNCWQVHNHIVPEGSSCGEKNEGKFCLNGVCVNENDPEVHLEVATTTTEKPIPQNQRHMPVDENEE